MRGIFALLTLFCVCSAHAEKGPDHLQRELARVIVGEADGSRADWAAILWTLRHRQQASGLSLIAVAQYSVILHVDTVRAKRVRSLGTKEADWGELPRLRRKQWADALAFVDEWMKGLIPDPCPESMHWDEPDAPKSLTPVDCGPTKNRFYAESPRWLKKRPGHETTFTGATTP